VRWFTFIHAVEAAAAAAAAAENQRVGEKTRRQPASGTASLAVG